jgi:hypothetical protein
MMIGRKPHFEQVPLARIRAILEGIEPVPATPAPPAKRALVIKRRARRSVKKIPVLK